MADKGEGGDSKLLNIVFKGEGVVECHYRLLPEEKGPIRKATGKLQDYILCFYGNSKTIHTECVESRDSLRPKRT